MRVLVIDDDPNILETCRFILGDEDQSAKQDLQMMASALFDSVEEVKEEMVNNFEVTTVNQGLLALEEASNAINGGQPYQIATIDMRMPPGINGLETAKRLIEIDSSIEIVIVTAYSDTSRMSMAKELGDGRFLLLKKPFDPDELTQIVQFLANRRDKEIHPEN
jgi:CheY-like chemotaxis protein